MKKFLINYAGILSVALVIIGGLFALSSNTTETRCKVEDMECEIIKLQHTDSTLIACQRQINEQLATIQGMLKIILEDRKEWQKQKN